MSFIIDLAVEFVGAIFEYSLMEFSPKSRAEKIYNKFDSFHGKPVTIRAGMVLRGGKFRFDETLEVPAFKAELKENNLLLYISEADPPICITGKSLSRFYTGKKGPSRICINTNQTDYLIDLS